MGQGRPAPVLWGVKGALPRLVRARRCSAGKPRIAGRASAAPGGERPAHGSRAPARPASRKNPVQTKRCPAAECVTDAARLARILQARGIRKTALRANRSAALHRRTHITEME